MKIGLEIEGIINLDRVKVDVGDYHNGIKCGDFWKCERDGSLSTSGLFKNERTVEFVSNILKNKKQLKEAMREFKKILGIQKKQKLNKSIYFNNSCGCHVHVSFKNYNFWKKSHPLIFAKTRQYFEDNINKSNLPKKLKKDILTQYDRSHARVVDAQNIRRFDREREFNFCSENVDKGLEWRSFNLLGVKKWKELRFLIKLAYNTLKYLEKQTKYWEDNETEEIENTPKPFLKKYNTENILKKDTNQITETENVQLDKALYANDIETPFGCQCETCREFRENRDRI